MLGCSICSKGVDCMNWCKYIEQKGLIRVQEFGQINNGWVLK